MGKRYKQCKKCIYGVIDRSCRERYICDRAAITNVSCLKRLESGEIVDIRGGDPENCKCFKPGKIDRTTQFRQYKNGG